MTAPINIFCLPYAGGSAGIYREWQAATPKWVNVIPIHLPARGVRQRMTPIHDWQLLLDLIVTDLKPYLDFPFAIYGHSMGALIGLELAHAIRSRFRLTPAWMGVSACAAPSRRQRQEQWLTCPREELIAEMKALNGTSSELLENHEFMDMLLPMLRADFHLCGTHRYRKRVPLNSPMLVMSGSEDLEVSGERENLMAWAEEVDGEFDLKMLNAGHFFINSHGAEVIHEVTAALHKAMSPAVAVHETSEN